MKIVIVGGGTAGWVSAAMFMKYRTDFDVTLIESSNIPIIGAGEGSVESFTKIIHDNWPLGIEVDELDFLRKTKATPKLAINLVNWKGDGKQTYSPIRTSLTADQGIDSLFLYSIHKYGDSNMASPNNWILDSNLSPYHFKFKPVDKTLVGYSYHFDGFEVGQYFKKHSLTMGAKLITANLEDIQFNENDYVKSITLSNGQVVGGDLFIDCTGFARALIGKTKSKWISYKEQLPTNAAITFSTGVSSKHIRFETLAKTMNNGWLWKIPLQNRHGNGYVYSDDFQSYEDSVEELERNGLIQGAQVRNIKFEAGRYDEMWYKNIVAVGLSSHFLEPLQATNIHITVTAISNLFLHYCKTKESIYSEANRKRYNKHMGGIVDEYKDLLQMHYLAGRDDTAFWATAKNELKISDFNKEIIEISKTRLLNKYDVERSPGGVPWPVWSHILDMAGLFNKDMIEKELRSINTYDDIKDVINKMQTTFNTRIKNELLNNEQFMKYIKL